MYRIILFLILSIPVMAISWRTLFSLKNHGFYRFFSWECILWLIITNYKFWFRDPFSVSQIFSWLLLFFSVYFVIEGTILLFKAGKPKRNNERKALFQFEKTTELIDTGIFKYIRHPLYTSLIFLSWGILLKNPAPELIIISGISTVFLVYTSVFDEKECVEYFGDKYVQYMKRTKRFIPFII